MVTVMGTGINLAGLSTNTKPTETIPNASIFYEMDTGTAYMFDVENKQWYSV